MGFRQRVQRMMRQRMDRVDLLFLKDRGDDGLDGRALSSGLDSVPSLLWLMSCVISHLRGRRRVVVYHHPPLTSTIRATDYHSGPQTCTYRSSYQRAECFERLAGSWIYSIYQFTNLSHYHSLCREAPLLGAWHPHALLNITTFTSLSGCSNPKPAALRIAFRTQALIDAELLRITHHLLYHHYTPSRFYPAYHPVDRRDDIPVSCAAPLQRLLMCPRYAPNIKIGENAEERRPGIRDVGTGTCRCPIMRMLPDDSRFVYHSESRGELRSGSTTFMVEIDELYHGRPSMGCWRRRPMLPERKRLGLFDWNKAGDSSGASDSHRILCMHMKLYTRHT
ncbi:hypothetical protein Tco_0127289 [Tanacetum coccineum]